MRREPIARQPRDADDEAEYRRTDDAEAEPAPATTQQGGSPDPVVASTTTPVGPAALLTPPTYHVADDTAPAVAVTIGELVVTTAAAALGRDTVDLVLADGSVDAALVLTVDHDRGLALLAPGHGTHVPSFDLAMAVRPGAELTIGDGSLGTAVLLDDGSVFTAAALDDNPGETSSVLTLHDAPRIGHPHATWGITHGNPIHDDVREIAKMVGVLAAHVLLPGGVLGDALLTLGQGLAVARGGVDELGNLRLVALDARAASRRAVGRDALGSHLDGDLFDR